MIPSPLSFFFSRIINSKSFVVLDQVFMFKIMIQVLCCSLRCLVSPLLSFAVFNRTSLYIGY